MSQTKKRNQTPSKNGDKVPATNQQGISGAEYTCLERYMLDMPLSTIDANASPQHLSLIMTNCIEHLKTHGFPAYGHLDVNKPEEGGIKFSSLKTSV